MILLIYIYIGPKYILIAGKLMKIIKMLNRNKMKCKDAKKRIECKKIKGRDNQRDRIAKRKKFRRDFFQRDWNN